MAEDRKKKRKRKEQESAEAIIGLKSFQYYLDIFHFQYGKYLN